MENSNVPALVDNTRQLSAFSSMSGFEAAQRMAVPLAKSTMVPKNYQNNVADCLLALDIAFQTGDSVFTVMQNLDMIHGKPSWRSSFVIAKINSSKRFGSTLKFRYSGEGDKRQCVAWTLDIDTREVIEGPAVSIAMAKAEGWYGRSGSKWPNMPELMLSYRSAAFFGRLYAPDLMLGMQTDEEMLDVTPQVVPNQTVNQLNDKIKTEAAPRKAKKAPIVIDAEPVATTIEPEIVENPVTVDTDEHF